jgi:hypothetical protein
MQGNASKLEAASTSGEITEHLRLNSLSGGCEIQGLDCTYHHVVMLAPSKSGVGSVYTASQMLLPIRVDGKITVLWIPSNVYPDIPHARYTMNRRLEIARAQRTLAAGLVHRPYALVTQIEPFLNALANGERIGSFSEREEWYYDGILKFWETVNAITSFQLSNGLTVGQTMVALICNANGMKPSSLLETQHDWDKCLKISIDISIVARVVRELACKNTWTEQMLSHVPRVFLGLSCYWCTRPDTRCLRDAGSLSLDCSVPRMPASADVITIWSHDHNCDEMEMLRSLEADEVNRVTFATDSGKENTHTLFYSCGTKRELKLQTINGLVQVSPTTMYLLVMMMNFLFTLLRSLRRRPARFLGNPFPFPKTRQPLITLLTPLEGDDRYYAEQALLTMVYLSYDLSLPQCFVSRFEELEFGDVWKHWQMSNFFLNIDYKRMEIAQQFLMKGGPIPVSPSIAALVAHTKYGNLCKAVTSVEIDEKSLPFEHFNLEFTEHIGSLISTFDEKTRSVIRRMFVD